MNRFRIIVLLAMALMGPLLVATCNIFPSGPPSWSLESMMGICPRGEPFVCNLKPDTPADGKISVPLACGQDMTCVAYAVTCGVLICAPNETAAFVSAGAAVGIDPKSPTLFCRDVGSTISAAQKSLPTIERSWQASGLSCLEPAPDAGKHCADLNEACEDVSGGMFIPCCDHPLLVCMKEIAQETAGVCRKNNGQPCNNDDECLNAGVWSDVCSGGLCCTPEAADCDVSLAPNGGCCSPYECVLDAIAGFVSYWCQ